MYTYEAVVEQDNEIKKYTVIASNVADVYSEIEARLKQQNIQFTVVDITKIDGKFNYEISEAI